MKSEEDTPQVFIHEFEDGLGYKGTIVVDNTKSFLDKILKRNAHYEQVWVEVYDFKKEKLLGSIQTKRIRKTRLARLQMAYSLRKQELLAWDICKQHENRYIPFSSAIEEGLIRQ